MNFFSLFEDKVEYQTGDILLFSGTGFFSRMIERCSRSKYSHVGMILKDPTYIDTKYMGMYFIESTIDYLPDEKKFLHGICISPLDEVLDKCRETGCKVYHRRIQNFFCDKDNCMNIYNAYYKIKDVPYNLNPIDWIYAKEAVDEKNIEEFIKEHKLDYKQFQKTKALWCSALVSYMYVNMNILSPKTAWNLIAPIDLAPEGDEEMEYINGCCLSKLNRVI